MKIVHLFNPERGSRYPLMIAQGLLETPLSEVAHNAPVVSLGEMIVRPSANIRQEIVEADLVFRAGDAHFGIPSLDRLLDWSKVIYYDFKDTTEIEQQRLEQCRLYVKRTWTGTGAAKLMPVPYGILNEYTGPPAGHRDIDLVYLFPAVNRPGVANRYRVYEILSRAGIHNSIIGNMTITDGSGRRAILEPPAGNGFIKYRELLSRARVVWTCQPNHSGGDSRVWEALTSGALVVTDWPVSNIAHAPVDGKHALIYDGSSEKSILETIERVKELLWNERRELKRIARAGKRLGQAHHTAFHRVRKILKAATK